MRFAGSEKQRKSKVRNSGMYVIRRYEKYQSEKHSRTNEESDKTRKRPQYLSRMEMLSFLPYLLSKGGGETFQDVVTGNNFPKKSTLVQKLIAGMDKLIVLH
jgi:hypothetical protein